MSAPDDLKWIAGALVPGDGGSSVGPLVPADHALLFTFAAVPSAARPYALLPTQPKVAAASIEGLGNPLTWRLRAAERAVAGGYRVGLMQRLRTDRILVSAPRLAEGARATVLTYLEETFQRSDLSIAVILGLKRPNRKPVLKVVTADGRCIAFAKVGWNSVSSALVSNEARILRTLADDAGDRRSFAVPRVIDHRQLDGLQLLVLQPFRTSHNARVLRFPVKVARNISATVERTQVVLASSPYWSAMCARVDAVAAAAGPATSLLSDVIEAIDQRYGSREILFGAWHGDFTPWNMGRVGSRLVVWDWERSGELVPVGLDAARFDLDTRIKIDKRPPRQAAERSAMSLGPALETMGGAPGTARLVATLHALEMVLRFEEARMAGVEGREPLYEEALDELLASIRRNPP